MPPPRTCRRVGLPENLLDDGSDAREVLARARLSDCPDSDSSPRTGPSRACRGVKSHGHGIRALPAWERAVQAIARSDPATKLQANDRALLVELIHDPRGLRCPPSRARMSVDLSNSCGTTAEPARIARARERPSPHYSIPELHIRGHGLPGRGRSNRLPATAVAMPSQGVF